MLQKKLGKQKKHLRTISHPTDIVLSYERESMPFRIFALKTVGNGQDKTRKQIVWLQICFCLKYFRREKRFSEHAFSKFITARNGS